MSLGDGDMPPWAADALDRGEDPSQQRRHVLPEKDAALRLAEIIGAHLDPRWLTSRALEDIAGKLIAARPAVRAVLDDLDADPKRIRDRDVVLKQQHGSLSDEDWWLGEAAYHQNALDAASRHLRELKSVHLPQLVDRDERGADEDDRRISDEIARDKAERDARGLAS